MAKVYIVQDAHASYYSYSYDGDLYYSYMQQRYNEGISTYFVEADGELLGSFTWNTEVTSASVGWISMDFGEGYLYGTNEERSGSVSIYYQDSSTSFNARMTAIANAIRSKASISGTLTIQRMITILNGLSTTGSPNNDYYDSTDFIACMTKLAKVIRSQSNRTDALTMEEMPAAIRAITLSGGCDSSMDCGQSGCGCGESGCQSGCQGCEGCDGACMGDECTCMNEECGCMSGDCYCESGECPCDSGECGCMSGDCSCESDECGCMNGDCGCEGNEGGYDGECCNANACHGCDTMESM